MMIINFLIVGLICYFLGAIPFTQIFSKILYKIDLRTTGTGNVGARNFYEVTGKKTFGIIVLLLDVLKGSAAVLIGYYFNKSFDFALYSATFVVLGHNYSIFLKFHGGKGLATAAGAFLLISPLGLFSWLASYFIFQFANKDIYIRTILATILLPIVIISSPDTYFFLFQIIDLKMFLLRSYPFFITSVCIVILLKHVDPFFNYIKGERYL